MLTTLAMLWVHGLSYVAQATPDPLPSGSNGTVTSIASGVAAVIAAYSAFKISKRDTNADDLKAARVALQAQKTLNEDLQADVLALRTWAFQVQTQTAGQGILLPTPPALKSERVQG